MHQFHALRHHRMGTQDLSHRHFESATCGFVHRRPSDPRNLESTDATGSQGDPFRSLERDGLDDPTRYARGGLGLGARGSSSTWADWSRMKPQFAQVSGNASMPRSTVALPTTCWSPTRSSQPCQSSPPQNGHAMRASRLRKKSKIRFVAFPICRSDRRTQPRVLARALAPQANPVRREAPRLARDGASVVASFRPESWMQGQSEHGSSSAARTALSLASSRRTQRG